MKIADSSVQMAAATSYTHYGAGGTKTTASRTSYAASDERYGGYAGDTASGMQNAFAGYLNNNYTRNGSLASNAFSGVGGITRTAYGADAAGISFRNSLLSLLFGRFIRAGMFGGVSQSSFPTLTNLNTQGGTLTQTRMNAYEYEEMSFQASGQAVTEDGRTLAFDMRIFMSREFMDYTQIQAPLAAMALMDPLVVNVGSAVAHVSDQTFRFDLDADGTEEDVAMLGSGSGFLALDKNGDGVINDGSELFGATSGDGFGDLRQYDSDGNGWIDENDEIFSKLKVWYKDGDGEDVLIDLKEADIGAIYLGEQATDFHLKNMDNRLNGMIRSTGFFLKESGGAGTIQHVDLAVGTGDAEVVDDADELAIGGENFVSGYGTGDRTASDVLIVATGNDGTTIETAASENSARREEESEAESAARRRARANEERERLKTDAQKRRAEKKRLNEELIEKAQERREEEEARIEQLFEDRAVRRETAEEEAQMRRDRHDRFEQDYENRRREREAMIA